VRALARQLARDLSYNLHPTPRNEGWAPEKQLQIPRSSAYADELAMTTEPCSSSGHPRR